MTQTDNRLSRLLDHLASERLASGTYPTASGKSVEVRCYHAAGVVRSRPVGTGFTVVVDDVRGVVLCSAVCETVEEVAGATRLGLDLLDFRLGFRDSE